MVSMPSSFPLSAKVLLLLLSVAFGGWSLAIWKAIDKIEAVADRMILIAERVEHMDDELDEHRLRPWHSQAGEAIIRLQEQSGRGQP